MRKLMLAAALALGALALAACQVTIPNPFGGTALTLTGNYKADLPGIQAYAAEVKAGIKTDVAEIKAFFINNVCPAVADAAAALNDPNNAAAIQAGAAAVLNSPTAAQKQINNVSTGLGVAGKTCALGSSSDWKSAITSAVDLVKTIQALIKAGST